MQHFLRISQLIGNAPHLVQGAGGNTSVKMGDTMLVKASGVLLKDVKQDYGYVSCNFRPIAEYVMKAKTESELDQWIQKHGTGGTASIETSLHAVLPAKYIAHVHSVYTNVFACMEGGERYLPYHFVSYHNPGLHLGRALASDTKAQASPVILLQNHGLIVQHNDPDEVMRLMHQVNESAIDVLKTKGVFAPFAFRQNVIDFERHFFPDSAVYAHAAMSPEISSVHAYLAETIAALGGTPRYIDQSNVEYILSMDKEKYRMKKILHD